MYNCQDVFGLKRLTASKVNTETEQSELSIVVDRVIKLLDTLEKGLCVLIKAKVLTIMIAMHWLFPSWIFTTEGEKHLSTQRLV